ncbi:hypothetical protein [Pararhizobium sp. DWP1-1-3]|uniref:hypothetical protein n=1 Tax=Pararhizobium sp. DWP1-1-3 TaxID=2804652 RepID=UPI003CE964E2
MYKGILTATVAIVALLPNMTSALADTTVRFCIGELVNKCPVQVQAFYTCGTSYEQAAADICTVYIDGTKKVSPFRLVKQGTHEGNQCGYGWAQVTCLD